MLPFIVGAQALPSERDWFENNLSKLMKFQIKDTAQFYAKIDSLSLWSRKFGSIRDLQWVTLAKARNETRLKLYGDALTGLNRLLASDSTDGWLNEHILISLRDLHSDMGAYDQAIAYHQKIDWKILDSSSEAHAPTAFLAFTYYRIGLFKEAIAELKRAIKAMENAEKHYYNVSYTNSLGVFYQNSGMPDSALFWYEVAKEKLIRHFANNENMSKWEYKYMNGLILGNIGDALASKGLHYEAIPLLKLDIEASLNPESPIQYQENGLISLIKLTKSYLATDQLELAKESYLRASELLSPHYQAELHIELDELLAEIQFKSGNTNAAYALLKTIKSKQDSLIFNRKRFQTLHLLEAYSNSKEQEIRQRSAEIIALRERSTRQQRLNFLFFGLILIALLVSLYSTYMFRQNRQRRKAIEQQNHEIEQQKNTIEEALREQKVLLREVNHRVKNNLQIISSMLFLERRKLPQNEVQQLLKDVQDRIHTMAQIHQQLYQEDHREEKNLDNYFTELVDQIIHSYSDQSKKISARSSVNVSYLPLDKTVPLSYILHELTTNSLKHAFLVQKEGTIFFGLDIVENPTGKEVLFTYFDNGSGLSNQTNESSSKVGIGNQLIQLLTSQLKGKLTVKESNGFLLEIRFPIQEDESTFAS